MGQDASRTETQGADGVSSILYFGVTAATRALSEAERQMLSFCDETRVDVAEWLSDAHADSRDHADWNHDVQRHDWRPLCPRAMFPHSSTAATQAAARASG